MAFSSMGYKKFRHHSTAPSSLQSHGCTVVGDEYWYSKGFGWNAAAKFLIRFGNAIGASNQHAFFIKMQQRVQTLH